MLTEAIRSIRMKRTINKAIRLTAFFFPILPNGRYEKQTGPKGFSTHCLRGRRCRVWFRRKICMLASARRKEINKKEIKKKRHTSRVGFRVLEQVFPSPNLARGDINAPLNCRLPEFCKVPSPAAKLHSGIFLVIGHDLLSDNVTQCDKKLIVF